MRMTPEQAAAAARERILSQARQEGWPTSVQVGRAWGGADDDAARHIVTRMRNAGELPGLYSQEEWTFYYPRSNS